MAEIRKIITKEEQERKKKRNYIIIVVILVLLMVVSPAGYSLFNNDSGNSVNSNIVDYNGARFYKNENGDWQFSYNGQNFIAKYNPLELSDIKVSTGLYISNYKDQVLYLEFNNSRAGADEISYNLFQLNQIPNRVSRACLNESCGIDAPVKSCSEDKIISFLQPLSGEEEKVYKDGNCVFIVANETNELKYTDAFLYNLLGI